MRISVPAASVFFWVSLFPGLPVHSAEKLQWKTYVNEHHRFSIRYPEDFKLTVVDPKEGNIIIGPLAIEFINKGGFVADPEKIPLKEFLFKHFFDEDDSADPPEVRKSKGIIQEGWIKINNARAYHQIVWASKSEGEKFESVYFEHWDLGKVICISFYYKSPKKSMNASQANKILEKVLYSFRWLDEKQSPSPVN